MEGFDIRTLALTNLILSVLLGVGSFVFAKIHLSFRSFYQLGMGYFLLALGFILIALRDHINDFLSIVIANALVLLGFTIVLIGILNFLHYPIRKFIKISVTLLIALIPFLYYYTYFQVNVNARIVIVCSFISGQAFFSAYKIYYNSNTTKRIFLRFLAVSSVFCGLSFLLRIFVTLNSVPLDNFMNAGFIHGLSMIAMILLVITSCLSLSWSAGQELAEKLEIQASIDSLTNLYNRRAFEEFAKKEINRAQRKKTTIGIILMDIDLFKQVNDTYGHQIGDKVLQEFSQRLKDSLRQYDIVARYGGEEFMLMLPDTDIDKAMIIAEKLRVTISQPIFDVNISPQLEISASFGVASACGDTIDWQKLVSEADRALYKAKENGRNIVESARLISV